MFAIQIPTVSTYCLLFPTKQPIYQPIVSKIQPLGQVRSYGFLFIRLYVLIFGPVLFIWFSGFGLRTQLNFIDT